MAETKYPIKVQRHTLVFWLCPECNFKNIDNEKHIYIVGDLEECQDCGCPVELIDTAPSLPAQR